MILVNNCDCHVLILVELSSLFFTRKCDIQLVVWHSERQGAFLQLMISIQDQF